MHRQMRALELLGEESPRALFFAASRRLMLDLLRGRTDTAEQLTSVAAKAAEQAGAGRRMVGPQGDGAYTAAVAGDTDACAAGAAECEAFALAEGITAVRAEAAFLWVCAGRLDRARTLVRTFAGIVLDELPRDVNWLLILQCVLEAALAVGDREVVADAAGLLAPYEGRAVVNAGAVMFHGITDDTLARAAAVLDEPRRRRAARRQALATYDRLGATVVAEPTCDSHADPGDAAGRTGGTVARPVRLHPTSGGLWLIGPEASAVPVRALRGFEHLRVLLRQPDQLIAAIDLVGRRHRRPHRVGPRRRNSTGRRWPRTGSDCVTSTTTWPKPMTGPTWAAPRACAPNAMPLIAELARATGLHGRPRTAGSSRRARIAAQKAITAAIDRVAAVDLASSTPAALDSHRAELHLQARTRRSNRLGPRLTYPPPDDTAGVIFCALAIIAAWVSAVDPWG